MVFNFAAFLGSPNFFLGGGSLASPLKIPLLIKFLKSEIRIFK